MNGRQLKEALRSGNRVYGTLIVSTSPHWPGAVRNTGIDFVFIDTEHIAIDRTTLAWMCQTYAALDLAPIVRIPEPDPFLACVALDGGAAGIIAPYVESVAQVRSLYGAVKLRPLKGAVLDRRLRAEQNFTGETENYVAERNAGNVFVINIESVPATKGLEEILAPGLVDAVQVGPHDLSCSLGVPEDYSHPLFLEEIRGIIETSRRHGVGVGVHFWQGIEQELAWAREGANLIVHSGDITLFSQSLRSDVAEIKKALSDGHRQIDSPRSEFVV